LVRQVRAGRVEIHAFCLMTSHYHLLVRSPIGELSEAMRLAQSAYSRYFNRRHKRDGSLIRGRYFSRPVDTIEYRRTLVRYIDHNPVKAGLVAQAHRYGLSSAAGHMAPRGMPWLNRSWVQAEACKIAGQQEFTASAYQTAFGSKHPQDLSEVWEWVEARMRSTARPEPVHDLTGTSKSQVRAWMQFKAKVADGHRVGLPVCASAALQRALQSNLDAQGPWWIEASGHVWRGAELLWIAGLHAMCGFTWQQIAERIEKPASFARRRANKHNELVLSNPDYRDRAAQVAYEALKPAVGLE